MTVTMNPYLAFAGTAREAMEFYGRALGGTPAFNTFGESGMADTPFADQIMHARLETPSGFTLMASDLPPGAEVQAGSTITISLSGDDDQQLRGYWDALSEGGSVTMPLEKQMWGDVFGQLTDRFGVAWMVNIAGQD